MSRPKRLHTSADIAAEIRRLEEERQRAIIAEDQRRGALLREYLTGPHGPAVRAALAPALGARDAYLFDFTRGDVAAPGAPPPELAALADAPPRRPAAPPVAAAARRGDGTADGRSGAPLPA
jgi:hypothetical protein